VAEKWVKKTEMTKTSAFKSLLKYETSVSLCGAISISFLILVPLSDQQQFFDTLEMIDTRIRTVSGVGGVYLPVRGRGKIKTNVDGITSSGIIKDALYLPNLGTN